MAALLTRPPSSPQEPLQGPALGPGAIRLGPAMATGLGGGERVPVIGDVTSLQAGAPTPPALPKPMQFAIAVGPSQIFQT